jgi:hypothetical protein
MQDEHQALQSSATWVWDLVVEGSGESPSLLATLSSTADLIKDCVDAAATNGVLGGGRGVAGIDHRLVALP